MIFQTEKVSFLLSAVALGGMLTITTVPSPAFAAPPAGKKAASDADAEEGEEAGAADAGSGGVCKASLLLDAASGEVLEEHNSHEALPPASMVKIMTAYTVMKRIQEGSIKLTDMVTVSANASRVGGSQVYLKQDEQFPVSELLDALLVQSANDAATALAEHIGGATSGFVEMMKAEAKAIGMDESDFHSPHGLPPGKDQQPDVVSAADFGKLARAILKDFPQLLEITAKQQQPFRNGEFIMMNHNHLLRTFQGCDGLKTGFYNKAGFSIAATAQRNGLRMIAVVMGCEGRKKRDDETARLLSIGFAQYIPVKLIDKGAVIQSPVPVVDGEHPHVMPIAGDELRGLVRRGQEKSVVQKLQLCKGVKAPVQPNTPCGTVAFMAGEREIGKVPVLIKDPIQEIGYIGRVRRFLNL